MAGNELFTSQKKEAGSPRISKNKGTLDPPNRSGGGATLSPLSPQGRPRNNPPTAAAVGSSSLLAILPLATDANGSPLTPLLQKATTERLLFYTTTMYDDAQRLGDVERRYRTTLSRTPLRSDRGDLGMYTFAGSNLHGGRSPNAPLTGTGVSGTTGGSGRPTADSDLYAPLKAAEYGRGYYDHLRATTPPRTTRSTPKVDLDDPSLFKTTTFPTDADLDYNLKRSTRHSEHWVPLTTHVYNTPYHTYYYKATPFSSYTYRSGGADDLYSYNYVDDYKRYSSKSSKVVDALDLSVTKSSYESDISHYSSKCSQMQSQLDEVNKWVYDAEMKLKSDVVSSRSKLESELAEISLIVDDTARYNEDLYRAIKKQAKQISKLNTQYDDMSRNLTDVTDTLEKTRSRCQSLQSDLSSVQSQIEMASKRVGTKTVRTTFLYG